MVSRTRPCEAELIARKQAGIVLDFGFVRCEAVRPSTARPPSYQGWFRKLLQPDLEFTANCVPEN